MRVLIIGEFSGRVRDAFRLRGHEAWSNDLSRSDVPGPHLRGDCRTFLRPCQANNYKRWDLAIAFPPCTYFCNSGVRWFTTVPKVRQPGIAYGSARWGEFRAAVRLWKAVAKSDIPRIAMENPIPHGYAVREIGPYSQIIQPYQFGHGEIKKTCLWLKNLPTLEPTSIVPGRRPRVHRESPGPDRWKRRSITYEGIADAMADQWGELEP